MANAECSSITVSPGTTTAEEEAPHPQLRGKWAEAEVPLSLEEISTEIRDLKAETDQEVASTARVPHICLVSAQSVSIFLNLAKNNDRGGDRPRGCFNCQSPSHRARECPKGNMSNNPNRPVERETPRPPREEMPRRENTFGSKRTPQPPANNGADQDEY